MLKTLFLVLMTTALINNVVLSQFLGICPFLGVSKNVKTAAGMGGAVIFVITIEHLLNRSTCIIVEQPFNCQDFF